MRIGIDNISTGDSTGVQGPGGMRPYLEAMVRGFARLRPRYTVLVFSGAGFEPFADVPPNVKFIRLPLVPRSRSLRIVYQQTLLPLLTAFYRLDVFFAIATVCPLLSATPVVLTVQFLQMFRPEVSRSLRTAYLKAIVPLAVARARRVIVFTRSGREELVRYTGAADEKIRIVPHGLNVDSTLAGLASASPEEYGLPIGSRYIAFVSATYWYKNHETLIRAFAHFARTGPGDIFLVLAGAEVHVRFSRLREIAEECGVADRVRIAGRVARVEPLYAGALMSVFPSLSETFGFPVLEAMACGCPVISSNEGSMAELGGEAAILVNPRDEFEMGDAMARLAGDEQLRLQMIARGRRWAEKFNWDTSAAQTLAAIESIEALPHRGAAAG